MTSVNPLKPDVYISNKLTGVLTSLTVYESNTTK